MTGFRRVVTLILGAAAIGVFAASGPARAADPAKGKTLFTRCAICHAIEPGKTKLGPSLAGIFGRRAGSATGFAYSPAMKRSNIVWNDKSLDAFIAKPMATVPGTRMAFPGIANPADRANLIAYLRSPAKARQE